MITDLYSYTKVCKVKPECLQMTVSPRLRVAEINIRWHFIYPALLVKKPIHIVSFLILSGTGITSLISFAKLSDDCVSKFASLMRARD